MRKLCILVGLMMVLSLGLTACGGTTAPTTGETTEATAAPVAEEATEAPEATEEPPATEEPTAEPAPEGATRDNMVPLGEPYTLTKAGEWELVFTVNEALIGDAATAKMQEVNQFNDDPQSGNQQILVNASVAVSGDKVPDTFLNWTQDEWSVVADGRPFDGSSTNGGVMPEPEFNGDILPPGQISGWMFFEVPQTDDIALVLERSGDRGGYWFALK